MVDVCWVVGESQSGVAAQSQVIVPELDATVVTTDPIPANLSGATFEDDEGIIHPTRDLATALVALDPDIAVFHSSNSRCRDAAEKVQPFMITASRIGVNMREQALTGEQFIRQIPSLNEYFGGLDHLIASSHRAEHELLVRGIDPERITTIQSAISEDAVKDVTMSYSGNLGMMGRVGASKNMLTVIEGVAGLKQFPNPEFPEVHIAGSQNGAIIQHMEEILGSIAPNFSTAYHGFVDEPLRFMDNLDIHCHPSWTENCPQTLLEAAAVGTPSIVADLSWADAYDAPFDRANPDDPYEWAEIIHQYIQDAEYRREMAEEQQAAMIEQYNAPDIATEYRRLFDELLDEMAAFKTDPEAISA